MSLLLASLTFWTEKMDLQQKAEALAGAELDRMADRLTNARGEIDAASVFVEQSPASLRHFSDFVGRLTLSRANESNWMVIASLGADHETEVLPKIRGTLGNPDFAFKPSEKSGKQRLYVIKTAGKWNPSVAGLELSDMPAVAAKLLPQANADGVQSFATAGTFAVQSDLFPDKRLWVFQRLNGTQDTGLGIPAIYVVRGFNIDKLESDASLDPAQNLGLEVSVGGRNEDLSSILKPLSPRDFVMTRTVVVEPFTFNISLTPPPSGAYPRLWILALLIGLVGTTLAFTWRAGQQAINNADSLIGRLRETRTALDDTKSREAMFFENTGTANCESNAKTGEITRVNRAMCELFGYPARDLVGKTSHHISHPDDIAKTAFELNEAKRQPDQARQFEKRYIRSDGTDFWALVQTKLYGNPDSDNAQFLSTIIDITDRKTMEVTKNNLLKELAHRVRNTVQLTASMARQTAKSVRNVNEYDSKFRHRLAALSAAQDVLFDAAWNGADLAYLSRRTLAPFESEHLKINLISLHLPTQHAQTFAIALHELAANSIAFGALGSGGNATFSGEIIAATADAQAKLHLTWHETGIQSKPKSRRHGFGHMMLFTALPDQFGGHAIDERGLGTYTYQCWLNLPTQN